MPTPAVALVLVSHSRGLAEGVVEVAGQMAPDVALLPAGGTDDGGLGTGFDRVLTAIETAVADGRSAVVLTDLGSAVLTAESVLEALDPGDAGRVRVVAGPFVEAAVEAAVTAQGGGDLHAVIAAVHRAAASLVERGSSGDGDAGGTGDARAGGGRPEAAASALGGGAVGGGTTGKGTRGGTVAADQRVDAGAGELEGAEEDPESSSSSVSLPAAVDQPPLAGAVAGDDDRLTARGTVVLRNRLGLHARPAAAVARTASAFVSRITVNGADARSVLALVALGAVGGTEVVLDAAGPDARRAVTALVAELEEGFGEA